MLTDPLILDRDTANPLEVLEQLAGFRDWPFDRRADDELAVEVPGRWGDLGLYFAWSPEISALHISCSYNLRVPEGRKPQVYELMAQCNEKLWLGHFAVWAEEGLPMFRYALLVDPKSHASPDRLEDVMDVAVSECERFYPAFQYVIWGGKTPPEAIELAMLDTAGEA